MSNVQAHLVAASQTTPPPPSFIVESLYASLQISSHVRALAPSVFLLSFPLLDPKQLARESRNPERKRGLAVCEINAGNAFALLQSEPTASVAETSASRSSASYSPPAFCKTGVAALAPLCCDTCANSCARRASPTIVPGAYWPEAKAI